MASERPPCGLPAAAALGITRGASAAYAAWQADGSRWVDARPIRAVGDRLAQHGYTVYYHGDLRHLTNVPPEDHTPFSATGWPGPSPYPYCMALDIMPPRAGQLSKLTGRPLPSIAVLAAQLRADRIAGIPAALWLKYMNWTDPAGDVWHDKWTPDYNRSASADAGHIHGSCRTDFADSQVADGYDLVARTEGVAVRIFGQDASHYDAVSDPARYYAEGFRFMTHKIGGDANDGEAAAWWSAYRGWRDRLLLGGYWVLYPGNPSGRADLFLARLDAVCPTWRDAPYLLQIDAEKWAGNAATVPSVAEINAFCARLRAKAPKLMPFVYGPKWVYGSALAGLKYPLWASSYVTGSGTASALYPGDTSTRWAGYSGLTTIILQFTSSAVITGQTTCDANAFRGSLQQLTALAAPGFTAAPPPPPPVEVPQMELADLYGSDAWPTRSIRALFKDLHGLRDVLRGDPVGAAAAAYPIDSPLMQIIAAARAVPDLTVQVTALRAELRAAVAGEVDRDTAEAVRDADNLAQVLASLATGGSGPIPLAELEEALAAVYGQAFNRAKAAVSAPRRADGTPMDQDDLTTMTAREQAQQRIEGE